MPKRSIIAASNTEALKHQAVAAWKKVAPRTWRGPSEVTILKDRGHSAVCRLTAVCDGSGVIAKRCGADIADRERAIHEEILNYLPSPALRFYGCVRDDTGGDAECYWLLMEDAGEEKYSYFSKEHRVLFGRWLGLVHSGARPCPPCLPSIAPDWYLGELRSSRESLRRSFANPALNEGDRSTLEMIFRQFDLVESHWRDVAEVCEQMPQSLIHGDLSPKNTRIRNCSARRSFFAIDWETAAWGTPAIDLGSLTPDLPTYLSAMPPGVTDAESVKQMALAGRVFRLIISIGWETKSIASLWPTRAIWHIASYREQLSQFIQAAGWGNNAY